MEHPCNKITQNTNEQKPKNANWISPTNLFTKSQITSCSSFLVTTSKLKQYSICSQVCYTLQWTKNIRTWRKSMMTAEKFSVFKLRLSSLKQQIGTLLLNMKRFTHMIWQNVSTSQMALVSVSYNTQQFIKDWDSNAKKFKFRASSKQITGFAKDGHDRRGQMSVFVLERTVSV